MKKGLLIFISIFLIVIIATELLVTISSFNWWQPFDPENLLGLLIFIANPVTFVVLLIIIIINFAIRELHENCKILFISIGNYILFLLTFDIISNYFLHSPYFYIIYYTILIVSIVVYAIAAIKTAVNTIKIFSIRK